MAKRSARGFSLVELSIVLVIIGLLAGAVLVGQDMIRTSELRSVLSDLTKYKTAVYAFRDKYQALPGDMPDAGTVFPNCNAVPANCNGNGNMQVAQGVGESFIFWQHLSLAGMIEDNYTGVPSTPNNYAPGLNVPSSRLGADTGYIGSYLTIFGHTTNMLNIAKRPNGANFCEGMLLATEAFYIDSKIDDGLADQGDVLSPNSCMYAGPDCTSAFTNPSGSYQFSSTAAVCRVFLKF